MGGRRQRGKNFALFMKSTFSDSCPIEIHSGVDYAAKGVSTIMNLAKKVKFCRVLLQTEGNIQN